MVPHCPDGPLKEQGEPTVPCGLQTPGALAVPLQNSDAAHWYAKQV